MGATLRARICLCIVVVRRGLVETGALADNLSDPDNASGLPLDSNSMSELSTQAPSQHFDLDKAGVCQASLDKLCTQVLGGEGRLAHCLRAQVKAAAFRKEELVPAPCLEEVQDFFVKAFDPSFNLSSQLELVPGIRMACQDSCTSLCGEVAGIERVYCLNSQKCGKDKSDECAAKVKLILAHASEDIRLTPRLFSGCKNESDVICRREHYGAKKACLQMNRKDLTPPCLDALFRQEVIDVEDIRLDSALVTGCRSEISQFCAHKHYGDSRIATCLSEQKEQLGFGNVCLNLIKEYLKKSSADYRLNFRVRVRCKEDIGKFCSAEKDAVGNISSKKHLLNGGNESGDVLRCLKDNMPDLQDSCQAEIKRLVSSISQLPLIDPKIRQHCIQDIAIFCPDARDFTLHLCLRQHLDDITPSCRQAELLQGGLEAGDITMKPAILSKCRMAISTFCGTLGVFGSVVLQCLQEKRNAAGFPNDCSALLEADMKANRNSVLFQHGIREACKNEIGRLCPPSGKPDMPNQSWRSSMWARIGNLGAQSCLRRKRKDITDSACLAELERSMREGSGNIELSKQTAKACKDDVAQFCEGVAPGNSRIHKCLLDHRHEVSKRCAEAEFEEVKIQSEDIRLSPKAYSSCKDPIEKLCASMSSKNWWQCLENSLDRVEVTTTCKQEVLAMQTLKQRNFLLNPVLSSECMPDARRICEHELDDAEAASFASHGAVISCLIRNRRKIKSDDCRASLDPKISQRLDRISIDPDGMDACDSDATTFCSEFRGQGKGKVHECLQHQLENLSDRCRNYEINNLEVASENWRLDPGLRRKCRLAVTRYCNDVPETDDGRVSDCLLHHIHDDDIEKKCRTELERVAEARAKGVRFNPLLAKTCAEDLKTLEAKHGESKTCRPSSSVLNGDRINCLTKYRKEIQNEECEREVFKVMQRESNDVRMRLSMMNACKSDLRTLCAGLAPGKGRMHLCLRQNIEKLQDIKCKAAVEDLMTKEAEDALISPFIRVSCKNEMKAFCKSVHHGKGRLLKCLALHSKEDQFSADCREALASNTKIPTALEVQLDGGTPGELAADVLAWLEQHKDNLFGPHGGGGFAIGFGSAIAALALCYVVRYVVKLWRSTKNSYTVVVAKEMSA